MEASPPIRLVVSDVDGTLVTNDKRLTPASIAAASRLKESGILLALVSSRPPRGLQGIAAALGLSTPRAGFNGGEIIDAAGAMLSQRLVPEAAARRTIGMLEARGVDVWLFADGQWLLRRLDGPYVEHERHTVNFDPVVVADFEAHIARAGKLVGVSADFPLLARAETEVHDAIAASAVAHRSQPYYLDINNIEANKGHAARALAAILGVDLASTACIGDMTNDVPMFAVAGLAIAMGNAPPEVQARAHAVTASNEADGWAQAIERCVLPRAPGAA